MVRDERYDQCERALDRALAGILEAGRLLELLAGPPDDKGDDEPGGDIDWDDGGPLSAS